MVRWRLFSDKKYLNFRAKNQQFWTFLANWKFEWNIFGDFRNQLNCACSRPTGGTCGLSLPVGLALLHVVRVRRRSRSHFYSLQTARQGERKIFESLSESERKRAALALITDLLFCFYTRFDNEKSDLDSKVKLCYPRPFEMALTFTIATFRWEHSLASFFLLFFRAKRIERSENFFSSPFDDFTVNFLIFFLYFWVRNSFCSLRSRSCYVSLYAQIGQGEEGNIEDDKGRGG